MINSDKYELILARGFLRRIKEAVEEGIYPDKEKGKEKVEYYQTRGDFYTKKLEYKENGLRRKVKKIRRITLNKSIGI